MQKIADLHAFILGLNLVASEQIDSYVDDLTVTPMAKSTDKRGQLLIAEEVYTATFFIERFPHGNTPVEILFAQLSAWLMQKDTTRDKTIDFTVDVDVLDTEVADIEFGIKFTEQIFVQEDPAGDIDIDGKRYRV